MREAVRQVPLSEEALRRGLQDQVNAAIPGVEEALIARGPDQLSRQFGIDFAESFDGLDDLTIALLQVDASIQCALIHHRGLPSAQTEVRLSTADSQWSEALTRVVQALHVDPAEVLWRRPTPSQEGQDRAGQASL